MDDPLKSDATLLRSRPVPVKVINQKNHVSDVNRAVVIGISGRNRIGRKPLPEEIVDSINNVRYVHHLVVVGVTGYIGGR
jgi:hypothetical protein